MIKAVLDINVFISALFWKGTPHEVFKKMLKGEFLNFASPQILEELKEKLLLKFKVPTRKLEEFLEIIAFNSQIVYPTKKFNIVEKDATDNKIIECAVEANASFIVSGDKHLLDIKKYRKQEIVSPQEFLSILLKKQKSKN